MMLGKGETGQIETSSKEIMKLLDERKEMDTGSESQVDRLEDKLRKETSEIRQEGYLKTVKPGMDHLLLRRR